MERWDDIPMNTLLLMYLSCLPQDNLKEFPNWDTAQNQLYVCENVLPILKTTRDIKGWGTDGYWHQLVDEVDFARQYWEALLDCHRAYKPYAVRFALNDLKKLIGPERYVNRWSPKHYTVFTSLQKLEFYGQVLRQK